MVELRLARIDAVERLVVGEPRAVGALEPALGGLAVDALDRHRLLDPALGRTGEQDAQHARIVAQQHRRRAAEDHASARRLQRPQLRLDLAPPGVAGHEVLELHPGGRPPRQPDRAELGQQPAAALLVLGLGPGGAVRNGTPSRSASAGATRLPPAP